MFYNILIANVGERDFNWTAYIIIAVSIVIGAFFLVRYMIQRGFLCNYCGDADLKVWDRVPEEDKILILEYFKNYEKREPDTKSIYICLECKTVFDDFVGQRGKGDNFAHSTAFIYSMNEVVHCRGFCKVCNNRMVSPDKENDDIRCKKCNTLHQWKIHEPSGFWFFMPPEDVEVLKKCNYLARPE